MYIVHKFFVSIKYRRDFEGMRKERAHVFPSSYINREINREIAFSKFVFELAEIAEARTQRKNTKKTSRLRVDFE